LPACVAPARSDCSWVKPIYFEDETHEWFLSMPLPDSVKRDLWQINRHNAKYEEITNGDSSSE
jgi:hypothetical protein